MTKGTTSQATNESYDDAAEPIAIIGLACRLPGAADISEFWQNLANGVESIHVGTLEDHAKLGEPEYWLTDPNYVPASSVLDDVEYFDAAFFGMSAREAQVRDPQHRLFLELAYTALEDGGYEPGACEGDVGVYAGTGKDSYQWLHTRRNPSVLSAAGQVELAVSSHPDYVATLASYKLNLRGPSLTMHTACSTSLVALHVACEALRSGECDMALCGGVNVDLPLGVGYVYTEGGIFSKDGHCRAFDARSSGTVGASGGAVILLKRLSEALADGDHIRALVLGNAINNDGAQKVGFTAPSQEGQAAVVAQALAMAGVNPRTISYVEAHGTGTALGDPIEIAALSSVFGAASADRNWCAVGSVKTNIGHLGPAAGAAGMVKAILALEHGLIPPSLNFEEPNPQIPFDDGPFYVNTTLARWESDGSPRRSSVSSFGMGGTNAHVVLQEAPRATPSQATARPVQLLGLSARTATALETAAHRLATHLEGMPEPSDAGHGLSDVAYTLRVGRRQFRHRLAVTATSLADAAAALTDARRRITGSAAAGEPSVAFMFPGQGAQYAGMGGELYSVETGFRDAFDECSALLRPVLGHDLRDLVLRRDGGRDEEALKQTAVAQPAIFAVEYALAKFWQSCGIEPSGMIGHSIGEYVAATLGGVFTLADALQLVAERGRLMQEQPPGAMLAVQLDEAEVRARLPEDLSIAALNGRGASVVSGPREQVEEFAAGLASSDIGHRLLVTSHAFHSPMMEPALARFRQAVAAVELHVPHRPFISNVTGEWITAADATDPGYWAGHLRQTVRFGDGLAALLRDGDRVLLECGPGRQLCGLARLQRTGLEALPSLPSRSGEAPELEVIYRAAGRLWVSGATLDRKTFGGTGNRLPLPTYPWERRRHWIDPEDPGNSDDRTGLYTQQAELPIDRWFAIPTWQQLPPAALGGLPQCCLLFGDEIVDGLAGALLRAGTKVIRVRSGESFSRSGTDAYTVSPASRPDYDALIGDITAAGGVPDLILHAWTLDGDPAADAETAWRAQDRGFFSLLYLVQALAMAQPEGDVQVAALTAGTQDVAGDDLARPEHGTVAGITKVIPLELPWLHARQIDIDPALVPGNSTDPRIAQLMAEIRSDGTDDIVALRGGRRWCRAFDGIRVPEDLSGLPAGPGLQNRGVYLITGGLGAIGLALADDLARRVSARLVLTSRSGLPPREQWDAFIAENGAAGRIGHAIDAVRQMEQSGSEVLVVAADVTNAADMRSVRQQTLERFGRLDGIVHAAGIPGGGVAEVKDRSTAAKVLRPKLLGPFALHAAFSDLRPDFVVLCSSVTAVAGGFGQVDYCAANNFLDAYARGSHGWDTSVVSVNWGAWLEVGMAAEAAAPAAFRALQRGDVASRLDLDHPVLSGRQAGEQGTAGRCYGSISSRTHWLLDDHRIAGIPVVPGTGHLELARAAADSVAPADGRVVELRDVVFIEPLAVSDDASAEVQVVLEEAAEGFDFTIVSNSAGTVRTHAQGSVGWATAMSAPSADLAAIRRRCSLQTLEGAQATISSSGVLTFGPHWGNLKSIHIGAGEQLARIEANDTVADDLRRWPLHPALLDEATGFGRGPDGIPFLPLGYGRLTVHAPLSRTMWSHLRVHESRSNETFTADISLLDDAGRLLVSISEFTMRRIDPESLIGTIRQRSAAAGPSADHADGVSLSASPAAQPREAEVVGGIRPADGATAFARMTTVGLGPQIVISATPVHEMIRAGKQLTQQTIEETRDLALATDFSAETGEYVAPRTEVETVIANIWAAVLGAERVGVTDDFFEMGGNSLVAMQIISMTRKELGVRLPMRSLFEDPTVAGAAAMIENLRSSPPVTGSQG